MNEFPLIKSNKKVQQILAKVLSFPRISYDVGFGFSEISRFLQNLELKRFLAKYRAILVRFFWVEFSLRNVNTIAETRNRT